MDADIHCLHGSAKTVPLLLPPSKFCLTQLTLQTKVRHGPGQSSDKSALPCTVSKRSNVLHEAYDRGKVFRATRVSSLQGRVAEWMFLVRQCGRGTLIAGQCLHWDIMEEQGRVTLSRGQGDGAKTYQSFHQSQRPRHRTLWLGAHTVTSLWSYVLSEIRCGKGAEIK